jgi:hypothetical protein
MAQESDMEKTLHSGVRRSRPGGAATRAAIALLACCWPQAPPGRDAAPLACVPGGLATPDPGSAPLAPEPLASAAARTQRHEVLFAADFERGATTGLVFDRDGVWSVVDGRLRAALPERKQLRSLATLAVPVAGDYAVDVDVHGVRGVDKGLVVGLDEGKGIGVDLRSGRYEDLLVYRGFSQLGRTPAPNRNGRWYRLRVEVSDTRMRVFVDKALKLDVAHPGDAARGRIALAAYTGGVGECVILFDNIVVTRLSRDGGSASGT